MNHLPQTQEEATKLRRSTKRDERYVHFNLWKMAGDVLAGDLRTDAFERFTFDDDPFVCRFTHCTAFARREEDGWYVSFAWCHELDQFCRATGRKIARRRYFSPLGGDLSDNMFVNAEERFNYDSVQALMLAELQIVG